MISGIQNPTTPCPYYAHLNPTIQNNISYFYSQYYQSVPVTAAQNVT
jgi:hypothetical protein